jgi:hypothetical protein
MDTSQVDKSEQAARPRSTICATTGKLAGKITRQMHELLTQLEHRCSRLGRLVYESAKSRAATPPPAETAAKKRRTARTRLQEERQALLVKLGSEMSRLHREQTPDPMNQPQVQELIQKIGFVEKTLSIRVRKRPAA